MESETKMVRVYAPDKIRLWNLINSELRTHADVIKHLLDKENARQIIETKR